MRFNGIKGKFWIVVSEINGMSQIPCRHYSKEMAFIEADRLAKGNKGKFYVFEASGCVEQVSVIRDEFTEDAMPF